MMKVIDCMREVSLYPDVDDPSDPDDANHQKCCHDFKNGDATRIFPEKADVRRIDQHHDAGKEERQ